MRNVAKRLLAVEAANCSPTDAQIHEAVRVFETLRVSLVRLVGSDGYAALLRRSLALARVEVPALDRVTINADSSLQGFDELATDTTTGGVEGPIAITAHLLGLLATFLGGPLTLQLVRDSYPDTTLDEKP